MRMNFILLETVFNTVSNLKKLGFLSQRLRKKAKVYLLLACSVFLIIEEEAKGEQTDMRR